MKVRAKMKCFTVDRLRDGQPDSTAAEVRLYPVGADSEENKTWSKYTPGGQVSLFITNPDAFNAFEPGKEYFVDFTPVA